MVEKKEKKNKALFLIGGICPKLYLFLDWWSGLSVDEKNCYILVSNKGEKHETYLAVAKPECAHLVKYALVVELDCEQYFTSWTEIFDYLPYVGPNIFDRFRDIRQAYASISLSSKPPFIELTFRKVQRKVQNDFKHLEEYDYENHLVCHSLGCLVASGIDAEVESLTFMGSPMTCELKACAEWTWKKVIKARKNIKTNHFNYIFSPADYISSHPLELEKAKVFAANEKTVIKQYSNTTGHASIGYLKTTREKGIC